MELQLNKFKLIFALMILSLTLTFGIIGYTDHWSILKALAYLEIGGSIGWNWFAITCMLFMVVFSFFACYRFLKPITIRKVPLFITTAIFAILFYYAFIDIFPRLVSVVLVQSIQGINPLNFVVNYIAWVSTNVPPTNLAFFFVYFGFTLLLARKFLKVKPLILAFLVAIAANALCLWFLGDVNIVIMSESKRVFAYYAFYVTAWFLNAFLFVKMWKKPMPTEFEKNCMGD